LYDPKNRGFPEAMSLIDRCQIAMLRELAISTDGCLVLKGGMAMRVAVGSMRLTKDVDFDRAEGVSTASVQSIVKRALQYAAQSAGLRGSDVAQTVQKWVGHSQPGVGAGAKLDSEQLRRCDYLHGTDGAGAAGSEFECRQDALRQVSVQGTAMALARARLPACGPTTGETTATPIHVQHLKKHCAIGFIWGRLRAALCARRHLIWSWTSSTRRACAELPAAWA
jgi:hypothetical protein